MCTTALVLLFVMKYLGAILFYIFVIEVMPLNNKRFVLPTVGSLFSLVFLSYLYHYVIILVLLLDNSSCDMERILYFIVMQLI